MSDSMKQLEALITFNNYPYDQDISYDFPDFYDEDAVIDPYFHEPLFRWFAQAANSREAIKSMFIDYKRQAQELEELRARTFIMEEALKAIKEELGNASPLDEISIAYGIAQQALKGLGDE